MARSVVLAYRRKVVLLMAVYTVLMLVEWPFVRSADSTAIRIMLALLPPIPVLAVLWLAALRMMHSDELEQRVHLIALSAAIGALCAASLTLGFLRAGGFLV